MNLIGAIFAMGGGMLLFVLGISAAFGALLWPYTINAWLIYFGKAATVVWWQGALLGLIPAIGYLCLPLAAMTWIVMLFIM